jgi:hypothetical protein
VRSPRKVLIEQLASAGDETDRYIDCAIRLRVHRRGKDGKPEPAELLPRAFGGVYDTFAAAYAPERRPGKIHELKVHAGQVPLITMIGAKGKRRCLGLGAPGGGKTMAIVVTVACLAVRKANGIGGVVAPTRARLGIVWGKCLELLGPLGLIASVSPGKKEISLVNGTLVQFRAAARRSEETGSPIAGHDWQWAVEDEQQDIGDADLREVDFRGRIAADFQVFSSATNEPRHEFQMRLQRYAAQPLYEVIRFSGYDNAFTPLEHWDAMKATMSAEDFDRYINAKDAPREGRVYPAFAYKENTAALPSPREDITARLCQDKYQVPYQYIIGWDPGALVSASVVLKVFAGNGADERNWFVVDEILTRDATTEYHARDLRAWLARRGIRNEAVIVIGDPHENKDTDRSDYLQMQAAGFTVKRSNGGVQIERRHRISMVNALLKDATEKRRLFLAASGMGPPTAAKTAECFGHLMYTRLGDIDKRHGTYMDLSHPGDAVGYALFPFEKFRGSYKPHQHADESPRMRRHLGS